MRRSVFLIATLLFMAVTAFARFVIIKIFSYICGQKCVFNSKTI